jgi:hypothetical protein
LRRCNLDAVRGAAAAAAAALTVLQDMTLQDGEATYAGGAIYAAGA